MCESGSRTVTSAAGAMNEIASRAKVRILVFPPTHCSPAVAAGFGPPRLGRSAGADLRPVRRSTPHDPGRADRVIGTYFHGFRRGYHRIDWRPALAAL